MPNLTDYIEEYLKKLLALSTRSYVEIQRRELAGKFACVPSQINYVLDRRFTLESGYLVESKRGGGGCIRIYRIDLERMSPWREVLNSLNGEGFEPVKVRQFLRKICEDNVISKREARLLGAIIQDECYLVTGMDQVQSRKLQQKLFGEALEEILKDGC
ncbi:MAG TPA: CtsR family transcriptional regulator [Candidatus Limnocylindrales bacterium]|nr:CtsR family transcriptional regulator [Candidatus Limnocylindrales bacterium]